MFKTKGVQLTIAAALLMAVSAPAFSAAQTPDCMRKIGICDRGEEHKKPERARSVGGESPTGGEQPEGNPTGGDTTDSSPQVE
jgi:hypothetical protein